MVAAARQARRRRLPAPSFEDVQRSLPTPGAGGRRPSPMQPRRGAAGARPAARTPLDDLRQKIRPAPQDRLARMVDLNEERTAQILRKWAHQAEAS